MERRIKLETDRINNPRNLTQRDIHLLVSDLRTLRMELESLILKVETQETSIRAVSNSANQANSDVKNIKEQIKSLPVSINQHEQLLSNINENIDSLRSFVQSVDSKQQSALNKSVNTSHKLNTFLDTFNDLEVAETDEELKSAIQAIYGNLREIEQRRQRSFWNRMKRFFSRMFGKK